MYNSRACLQGVKIGGRGGRGAYKPEIFGAVKNKGVGSLLAFDGSCCSHYYYICRCSVDIRGWFSTARQEVGSGDRHGEETDKAFQELSRIHKNG